ncbi:maleamate amidohydrolase [Thalassovita litoralis]|jgi:maleamate amidohydrolase|uniref:Maleamate amidohydrolase n=1 Tax=Thalassovita litoralis TaxID=1010611 RepID=A0A521C4Y4_9RHOB|nr:isochorismatase family protein [Thalassovita litoralis]SMO54478.1 maleamate amidohydrolase [Thalassovita litoralis]
MTTAESFKNLGYGSGSVGFGSKVAVVVVDFQRGLTDPAFPMGNQPAIQTAVDNTARLLKATRAAGLPVVSCYTGYSTARDALGWKVDQPLTWRIGGPECELDPRIYQPDYDIVFAKTAPSIFFHTGAAPVLHKEGVDTVIITGCTTSGCVRASIIDAFSYGFRVIVAEDCCGDPDPATHRANLEDVSRRYCDVLSLDQILTHIPVAEAAE